MSNRDALRRLTRKFPAPPDAAKILDDLRNEPDRTAAIVGVAILEAALEKLLTKHLKVSTKSMIGHLFMNKGPLADFHSKILVASAFGFIPPNLEDELHRVRVIRNAFAHSSAPVSFQAKEIAAEIEGAMIVSIVNKRFHEHSGDYFPAKIVSACSSTF